MSEVLYLIDGDAYERLVPLIRAYETALIRRHEQGDAPSGGVRPSAFLGELKSSVLSAGRPALRLSNALVRALKQTLAQVKEAQPGTHDLLTPLYQSIGLSAAEARVLVQRLEPWRSAEVEAVLEVYAQAASSGQGVVVLPAE